MTLTLLTAVMLSQLPTASDLLDNAEIGDAVQYISLRSRGAYEGELVDKAKGNTKVQGSWKVEGDTLQVKATSCKGPACKDAKKDYTAKATVAAERALLLETTAPAPFLPSGSYYCHYLGCEQRLGIEVVSNGANVRALHAVLDHLIEKNRGRNTTVVWIGARPTTETKQSRVEVCGRDPVRAQQALDLVKADFAETSWFGEVAVVSEPITGCLWDVRVVVRDDVTPPAPPRKKR